MSTSSALVIDDDPTAREAVRYVLEKAGFVVREAGDGREGLESYRRTPADVVVTDLFMPEKDGHEFLMELKSEFPESRVIVMSAIGDTDLYGANFAIATALGAEATLYKPLDRENLLLILRRLNVGQD